MGGGEGGLCLLEVEHKTGPLIRYFPENSGRREEGRAMQDILTGCDGWTAAGATHCGGKSQLRGAFGLRCLLCYYRSVSGWVCALRM